MNTAQIFVAWQAASMHLMLALMHFLWQGMAIAILAGIAHILLGRSSARARYAVLLAGLALMALCPAATLLLGNGTLVRPETPSTPAALLPEAASAVVPEKLSASLPTARQEVTSGEGASALPSAPQTPIEQSLESRQGEPWAKRIAPVAVGLYMLGVILLLVRLMLGLHGGARLCRDSQSVTDPDQLAMLLRQLHGLHMRCAPVLAHCPAIVVPTVVGVLRPTILLPLSFATGLAPHEMEVILAHELTHIRRYDHIVNLLQRLVESFLFFHPAVWWLSRRIRIEREHCCDDVVVSLGVQPAAYAASLLHVAEMSRAVSASTPALIGLNATDRPSELRSRIARLLGAEHELNMRLIRPWPLAVTLILAAVFAVPTFVALMARPMTTQAAIADQDNQNGRGKVSGGLQARVLMAAPDADKHKMQGVWRREKIEVNGVDLHFGRHTVIFAGDKMTTTFGFLDEEELTFKLDPTQTPKAIDLEGKSKKHRFLGIYQLDRDTLTICVTYQAIPPAKEERPGSFTNYWKGGSYILLLVLTRDRPEAHLPEKKTTVRDQRADDAKSAKIADLLEKFASAEYFWQQVDVARELIALGDKKIIPQMEKSLDTTDRRKRCNAAMVMAGLGDKRGLAAIIGELEDKKPGDRPLSPLDHKGSDGKLVPEIAVRQDRYYAALILGQLRAKEAVSALIAATTDEAINYRAAVSLGQIGDKSAIPALRKMAEDFPTQRLWAGYGLALLGESHGFDLLAKEASSNLSWVDRRHAVEALGTIGDSRAVPVLVKALKENHANVRVSAAGALGKIGDQAALPALTEALSDTERTEVNAPTTVQSAARRAIEAIKAKKK